MSINIGGERRQECQPAGLIAYLSTPASPLVRVRMRLKPVSFILCLARLFASAQKAKATPQPLPASPSGWSATSGGSNNQVFTSQFTGKGLTVLDVLINRDLTPTGPCFIAYDVGASQLYLVTDAGGLQTAPASNSECSISLVSASASGTTFTLILSYTFTAAFANATGRGDKIVFASARDQSGTSAWIPIGVWRVWPPPNPPSPQYPVTSSVSTNSASQANQLLTAQYTKAPGTTFNGAWLLINSTLTAVSACYSAYGGNGYLYLLNDAGTAAVPGAIDLTNGSGGPLSNSQCTVSSATQSISGDQVTINANLIFSSSFMTIGGPKVAFGGVQASGISSDWQPVLLLFNGSSPGGAITLVSVNLVSKSGSNLSKWEPSTAAATVGSAWVTSWTELNDSITVSYVAPWNGATWGAATQIVTPFNQPTGDIYVAWDSFRSRFVLVAVSSPPRNVWFTYSTDQTGSSWIFPMSLALSSSQGNWDYPSVAVDASGNVIVGAVKRDNGDTQSLGFWAVVSSNGQSFPPNPNPVALPDGTDPRRGITSRIVATNNRFHAFVPHLLGDPYFVPTDVYRYESVDGVTWSGPSPVALNFGPVKNNSPQPHCGFLGCFPIFYAPLLQAKGFPNGLWTVAFPINNGSVNNTYICTSDRGCGIANSDLNNDQFLIDTSVSSDSAYWLAYLTYKDGPTVKTLAQRFIYFPPGQAAILGPNPPPVVMDPTSWKKVPQGENRCITDCYAAGDYIGIASNPSAASSGPYIQASANNNELFQSFVQDPPATSIKANFIPFPLGASLSSLVKPIPPQTYGRPPELRKPITSSKP